MNCPDDLDSMREHVCEFGTELRSRYEAAVVSRGLCSDAECRWPAFYDDLSDDQLEGAMLLSMRFGHEMGGDSRHIRSRFNDLLSHLVIEQARRRRATDDEILSTEDFL